MKIFVHHYYKNPNQLEQLHACTDRAGLEGSAAGKAAAPLSVDDHLGSAAGGATTPLEPIILTPIWLQAWIAGCPLTEPGRKSGGRNIARR